MAHMLLAIFRKVLLPLPYSISGEVSPANTKGFEMRGLAVGLLGMVVVLGARNVWGETVNLGTAGNAANWNITGAGATGSPAFQVSIGGSEGISLTSNGYGDGIFASGGSSANFNGFWYADETFSLPSDAFNVALSFDSLYGDDRAVLELNGTVIGDANYFGATGSGVMAFPPGPPDVPYTFTGTTSGAVTSGFLLGGVNNLRLIVNNTGAVPITAPTATFQYSGDATDARINAILTYDVPEPSTFILLGVGSTGLLVCGCWRRRRK